MLSSDSKSVVREKALEMELINLNFQGFHAVRRPWEAPVASREIKVFGVPGRKEAALKALMLASFVSWNSTRSGEFERMDSLTISHLSESPRPLPFQQSTAKEEQLQAIMETNTTAKAWEPRTKGKPPPLITQTRPPKDL
jgi:hypothetical protein